MLTPFLEIKELTEKCETNETETKQKEFCNYTASSPSSGLENCQFNASSHHTRIDYLEAVWFRYIFLYD